jgi:DNA (cytosine-5)-methyltransferase 1
VNYYNEHDPKAAAWLRELISAGVIPAGHVDERSIVDVQPGDLEGYVQCHFFAGIGGWPFALQLAEWDAARPVWTGSCPCQPFSAAGKRKDTSDERHLWPEMFRLIRECKPPVVFGEQVASPDAMRWFDGVSVDLEGEGYAVGAADLCAAGIGAPHIRQRLYWVANMHSERRNGRSEGIESETRTSSRFASRCADGRMGNPEGQHERRKRFAEKGDGRQSAAGGSGAWSGYDIIPCLDGKARRVESQSQPLVDGISAFVDALRDAGASENEISAALNSFPLVQGAAGRVMLLKGMGNAIVPQVAAEFVRAFMYI